MATRTLNAHDRHVVQVAAKYASRTLAAKKAQRAMNSARYRARKDRTRIRAERAESAKMCTYKKARAHNTRKNFRVACRLLS